MGNIRSIGVGRSDPSRNIKELGDRALRRLHDTILSRIALGEESLVSKSAFSHGVSPESTLQAITREATRRAHRDRSWGVGSGIAGTDREDSFSLELLANMPDRCKAEWVFDRSDSLGESFDVFARSFLLSIERDVLLNERLSTKEVLELVARQYPGGTFSWVRDHLRCKRRRGDYSTLERLFDSLDLWFRWSTGGQWSRSFARFPSVPATDGQVRLALSAKRELIQACRGALAARGRETDPMVYTDPKGVTLFACPDQVDVALFELRPDRRLPLESYVGFVAARNRVPVAYGGAWMLGYRGEIGINVFEEFRGGDSRGLFRRVMETYESAYGVRTWIVHPSQFGDDNEEALASGAFWFYYRLGFQPENGDLRRLAERERAKRQRNPRHRTSRANLVKLSQAQLVLPKGGVDESRDKQLVTQAIATRILRIIASRYSGDKAAARHAATRIWRRLSKDPFPESAEMLLLFPNVLRWSKRERSLLVRMLFAKSTGRERDFVRMSQEHSSFRSALRAAART